MKFKIALFILALAFFLLFLSSCEQDLPEKRQLVRHERKDMVLLAGGDLICASYVEVAIRKYGSDYPFKKIQKYIDKADIAFANLECVISDRGRVRSSDPRKINYDATPAVMETISSSGFDVFSIANNHVYDMGADGVKRFRELLGETDLYFGGAGKNIKEASMPEIIKVNGLTIAFLFYNSTGFNFCAGNKRSGYNCMPFKKKKEALEILSKDIKKIKNADIKILTIHWGKNYNIVTSKEQREFAHAAVDMGIDIILGHSSHLFHGIEIYKDKPILYDMGDLLVSNPDYWDTRSFLYYIHILDGKFSHLEMVPIYIPNSQVRIAEGLLADEIIWRKRNLSSLLGTSLTVKDGRAFIYLSEGVAE